MTELLVETELTGTRDGTTQLQRRWRRAPDGDSGRPRSAVILVHGIGEHSGRYDHVGRYLAARGHDVLGFDNRGFGQSGGRRGHIDRFDLFLDDVEDIVVERRQLAVPVVLLGHSLGGLIAATYLVEGRPLPDLAILSSPALGAEVPLWQKLAAPALSRLAPNLFVKGDIDGDILSKDPEVKRSYEEDPLRVAGGTARLGQEIFTTMAATSAAIERIDLPCYVLHGSADRLAPAAVSAPLARLPSVTYRLWDGLRHECFNELEQDQVLAEMADWLDGALAALPDQRPST